MRTAACDPRVMAVVVLTLTQAGSPAFPASDDLVEMEAIRATERERVRALVEADMAVARRLHAEDFQLVNPLGEPSSKEDYLGAIASGRLDYVVWKPEAIQVRLHGDAAVIRYQSELEVVVDGTRVPRRRHWHTDSYEKHHGQWRVVWSQATAIR